MPQGGTSNEYPQHIFWRRNKKNNNFSHEKKRALSEAVLIAVELQREKNLSFSAQSDESLHSSPEENLTTGKKIVEKRRNCS